MSPLESLSDEIRLGFHALTEFARREHGARVDPSGRAVLEHLARGATTVPDLARRRGVSRQHVQTIINDLQVRQLVEAVPNPRHKRSPLFTPTAGGRQLLESILDRERQLLAPVVACLGDERLAEAAATIAEVRAALASRERTSP